MAGKRSYYECQQCGHQSPRWLGRCPDCATWGSLTEVFAPAADSSSTARPSGPAVGARVPFAPPVPLTTIPGVENRRLRT
ncbi:MAG TPA: DNA repair protein RadA, partial [Candidatus Methylomirabilis sp.]|nr:DNA repair protein RadA [Candidatus Methylomirabilis sp.]